MVSGWASLAAVILSRTPSPGLQQLPLASSAQILLCTGSLAGGHPDPLSLRPWKYVSCSFSHLLWTRLVGVAMTLLPVVSEP